MSTILKHPATGRRYSYETGIVGPNPEKLGHKPQLIPINTDIEDRSLSEEERFAILADTASPTAPDYHSGIFDRISDISADDLIQLLSEKPSAKSDDFHLKGKLFQKKAMHLMSIGKTEEADRMWEYALKSWSEALKNEKHKVYLFAVYFNNLILAFDLDSKFPELVLSILETAVVNFQDYRVLSGYIAYLKYKGVPMQSAIAFIANNLPRFNLMELERANELQVMLKYLDEGDDLKYAITEGMHKYFKVNNARKSENTRELPEDSYAYRCSLILIEYTITEKSDYIKAKKLTKEAIEKFPNHKQTLDRILARINDGEEPETQLPLTNYIVKDGKFALTTDKNSANQNLQDYADNNLDTLCRILLNDFDDKKTTYSEYYLIVCGILTYLQENINKPNVISVALNLLNEVNAKTIRISKGLKGRLMEIIAAKYFEDQKYQEVLDLCNLAKERSDFIRPKLILLAIKSEIELSQQSNYLRYAIENIDLFRANKYELELFTILISRIGENDTEFDLSQILKLVPKSLIGKLAPLINQKLESPDVGLNILILACFFSKEFSVKFIISNLDLHLLLLDKLSILDKQSKNFVLACQEIQNFIRQLISKQERESIVKVLITNSLARISPQLCFEICLNLLNSPSLSQTEYDAIINFVSTHPEFKDRLNEKLNSAKNKLGIQCVENISPTTYFSKILEKLMNRPEFRSLDFPRIVYLFIKFAETNKFYEEIIQDFIKSNRINNSFEYDCEFNILFKHFGIKKIYFQIQDNGTIRIEFEVCKDKDDVADIKKFELKLVGGELEFPTEVSLDSSKLRIISELFKTELLEIIASVISGLSTTTDTKKEFETETESYKKFKAEFGAKEELLLGNELTGVELIAARNKSTLGLLEPVFRKLSKDPRYPLPEQIDSIILSCIEIITKCRDLDTPISHYKSRIDTNSPMYEAFKYLKIFNPKYAAEKLQQLGVNIDELEKLELDSTTKNNFSGYYEIYVDIPSVGMTEICFFLDSNGSMKIPGVSPSSEFYKIIWMLVMESLTAKVVPEMNSYSRTKNKYKLKKRALNLGYNAREFDADSDTRRKMCSELMFQFTNDAPNETLTYERKTSLLETIATVLNTLDLVGKDISHFPLYYKQKNSESEVGYERLENLFIFIDGIQYINFNLLEQVFGISVDKDENHQMYELGYVPLQSLPEDIRTKILSDIKIQVLSGRSWRIPVSFLVTENDLENITGNASDSFELGNFRIRTKPHRMSQNSEKIYRKHSRIEIDFTPRASLYLIVINPLSKEIEWKYIGPASKDENGEYNNLNAIRYQAAISKGQIQLVLNSGVETDQELIHKIVECESHIGYKQGVFIGLGKYFARVRNKEDIGLSILIETLEKYLGIESAKAIASAIKQEQESSKPTQVDAIDKTVQVVQDKVASSLVNPEPTSEQSIHEWLKEFDNETGNNKPKDNDAYMVSSNYPKHPFFGKKLYILSQDSPEYKKAYYQLLKDEDVQERSEFFIVRIGSKTGRFAKIRQSYIIKI